MKATYLPVLKIQQPWLLPIPSELFGVLTNILRASLCSSDEISEKNSRYGPPLSVTPSPLKAMEKERFCPSSEENVRRVS